MLQLQQNFSLLDGMHKSDFSHLRSISLTRFNMDIFENINGDRNHDTKFKRFGHDWTKFGFLAK